MAKWGEGDPRWIVEERPDATNVNNWHWSEKNADSWSQQKLKELFTDVKMDENSNSIKIKSVTSCDGEARVTNRKNKLFVFFEWNISLAFEAIWTGCRISGNIDLQNFSEDLDDLDICVRPHFNTPAFAASIVKSQIERGSMRTFFISKLEQYIQDIKSEYGGQNGEACSTGNIVKSKAIINKSESHPPKIKTDSPLHVKQKKSCKKRIKSKSSSSNDLIFYVSLVSLVGLGVVGVIKLARMK